MGVIHGINYIMQKKGNKPLTKDEIEHMLFWGVALSGNSNKVAQKMTEFRGKKTSRKVVWQIAQKYDFDAKAPILKAKVDAVLAEQSSTDLAPRTSQEIHLTEVGLDLLSIDRAIIKQSKRFMLGDKRSNTPFRNVAEVISALKYVAETVPGLMGQGTNEMRDAALVSAEVNITQDFTELLNQLEPEQRNRIISRYRDKVIEGTVSING